jgi:hypothetical protein
MASDDYRRNAIECLRIADETISARSRVLLIHMAESWMRLSQKAEKNLTTDLVYETPQTNGDGDALESSSRLRNLLSLIAFQ